MKVYLKPLGREYAADLHAASQVEEIRFLTNTQANFSLEQIQAHLKNISEDETRIDFAICLLSDDSYVGELTIYDIDKDNESAGFRIALGSLKHFNKGYGSQAISLVLAYVFEELKLNRLQLEVYSHNPRAINFYKKQGFIEEGRLREAIKIDNHYYDEIIMSVINTDYFKSKLKVK
ncbi:MAG: GNAT family N-acetyltransferase [Erysipelothrix sp.]|nr:GNAT family N-acetyltransferase [Erysipelothrix sp.]